MNTYGNALKSYGLNEVHILKLPESLNSVYLKNLSLDWPNTVIRGSKFCCCDTMDHVVLFKLNKMSLTVLTYGHKMFPDQRLPRISIHGSISMII